MILQVETRRSLSFPARVALGAFALLALTFVPIRAQGGPAPQDAGPKPGAIARIPFARALDAIGVPAVSSTRVFTTETVAEVEGIVATPNDLLRIMAAREGRTIATLQVTQAIAQMELDAAAMTVTDDEVNAEIDRMAGASRSAGALSRDELRPSARTAAAFRKLSSGSKPKPPTGDAKANDMMLQLFIRQRMESYAIRYRGDAGVTLPGDVWAEITAKNGTVRMIRSDDIVESLVALVRGPSLARAQEQLIDGYLLGFTLVAAGKTVTEADVLAYTQRMTEQYQPPFDWKMICQFRGTTIGGEQMRFRLIEAMKRGTGFTANDKTIGDFFNEHRDAFGGACRSVSQVLFRTSDPRTGEPTGDPAEKLRLATLAVEKIREGADFAMIARQFSEDENTASAGGSLAQPIKEFGGGVEPEFLAAVLAMKEPGEVVGPIKTSAGYHVIRLDKLTPPRPVDPTAPTFRNWILDELMNEQMRGTLGLLRLASKITVPPLTRLR